MNLDLSKLQSVRTFADNFLKKEPRLDILINNAGELNKKKTYILSINGILEISS